MTTTRARTAAVATTAALAAALLPGAAAGAVDRAAVEQPAGEPAVGASATETATGYVYEDLDRDGQRDAGEPGVPGVRVSNGLDVVLTGADGTYRLPVTDETIVFVSKPSGWMVPVDQAQLPQFSYLHYPDGTPHELRYGGIAPTGPLPDSVDFPLHRQDESGPFDAILLADPQTRSLGEIEQLRQDVVTELAGTDAAFGLTVGDVVNDPLDLFGPHNAAIAGAGIPWWNLPGNHDMDYDAPTDDHATDTYKSVYGPTDYSFDYGDVHVVALDDVEKLGAGSSYRGHVSDRQLQWLANDLAHVDEDTLVLLAAHIPLRTDATTSPGVNVDPESLRKLLKVLEGRRVWSVAGHDTSNSWQMLLGEEDGWSGAEPFHHQVLAEGRGGGWTTGPVDERGVSQADMADGNPNGYYVATFEEGRYRSRFKPASLPADFQLRLSLAGGPSGDVHLPGGPSGSTGFAEPPRYHPRDWASADRGSWPQVTANVFDGGPRHRVELSVDGRPFRPMGHAAPAVDPYVGDLYERLAGTPEQPARPEPSSHLWTAPLPASLAPGTHSLTVRSTDPYGQVSQVSATFQVRSGRPDGD